MTVKITGGEFSGRYGVISGDELLIYDGWRVLNFPAGEMEWEACK